jgi:hypothetical protein
VERFISVALLRVWISSLLLSVGDATVAAMPVTYAWSGALAPIEEAIDDPDPWGLGHAIAYYTVEATLPDLSQPLITQQEGFAAFDVPNVRVFVEGLPLPLEGPGSIMFCDLDSLFGGAYSGQPDQISLRATISYMGTELIFASGASLPSDTFFFPTVSSLPPLFSPVESAQGASTTAWREQSPGAFELVYWRPVSSSLLVTSTLTPEPSALLLALTGAALWRRQRPATLQT